VQESDDQLADIRIIFRRHDERHGYTFLQLNAEYPSKTSQNVIRAIGCSRVRETNSRESLMAWARHRRCST
jgi:hypothetical protein